MDACSVCTITSEPTKTESRQKRLNMHNETQDADGQQQSNQCIVCQSTCKSVADCRKFLEYDRNQRWISYTFAEPVWAGIEAALRRNAVCRVTNFGITSSCTIIQSNQLLQSETTRRVTRTTSANAKKRARFHVRMDHRRVTRTTSVSAKKRAQFHVMMESR